MNKLMKWLETYWFSILLAVGLGWMLILFIVQLSWLYGYWYNGMTSGKFDLDSCWKGVTASLGGIASLVTTVAMAVMRFGNISKFNTVMGSTLPKEEFKEPTGTPSDSMLQEGIKK